MWMLSLSSRQLCTLDTQESRATIRSENTQSQADTMLKQIGCMRSKNQKTEYDQGVEGIPQEGTVLLRGHNSQDRVGTLTIVHA